MRGQSPPSLYADTACPALPTPPLDGDRSASVAIVGGGFTGLSAALHLAKMGADVIVLEAQEPGWGASGRNGGQVNPGLKHDPDTIIADFGPDLGARMVALSGQAPGFVFDLIQRYQIPCAPARTGTLRCALTPGGEAAVNGSASQWIRRGDPVSVLDQAAAAAATGTGRYRAAMLDARGGHLNPLSLARGLVKAAVAHGACVHGSTTVQNVRRFGQAWRVETATGTVTAETLILATNGYTDDVWPGLRHSLVPMFSAIAATEPLPDPVARAVMPSRASLYEAGAITVYYRIDNDNRLLIGGRSVQRDVTSVADLTYLRRYAVQLWPALREVRWTHGWSGRLAMTRDHYPHIHEPAENVLVCVGYNGRGVAISTAMGLQLAQRVMGGRTTKIDMPITSIKSIPFHALWPAAVAARTVYGQIRARLDL